MYFLYIFLSGSEAKEAQSFLVAEERYGNGSAWQAGI